MTLGFADILGLIGSVLMLAAYAYSNAARSLNFALFNLLNLVGSGLMIASLTVSFNLAAMLLEIAWAGIAAVGVVKALTARRRA